jgi:hypothetical protein
MKIVYADAENSASGNLVLGSSGQFLRATSATVNFTSAEAAIMIALVDAGAFGLCIRDILGVLGHDVSDRSIHVGRTHISKIRQKLALIGEGRISLHLDRGRQRYAFAAPNL